VYSNITHCIYYLTLLLYCQQKILLTNKLIYATVADVDAEVEKILFTLRIKYGKITDNRFRVMDVKNKFSEFVIGFLSGLLAVAVLAVAVISFFYR